MSFSPEYRQNEIRPNRLVTPELKHRASEFYIVSTDGRRITCHLCGYTSDDPRDVAQKHCPNCLAFHEDHILMIRLDEGYRAEFAPAPSPAHLKAA